MNHRRTYIIYTLKKLLINLPLFYNSIFFSTQQKKWKGEKYIHIYISQAIRRDYPSLFITLLYKERVRDEAILCCI